jgi:hypothetical protein
MPLSSPAIRDECWRRLPTEAAADPEETSRAARPDALEARERRLLLLLAGIWIVNLFDLGFTLLALEQRLLVELNPLATWLLPYGPTALAGYKLVLVSLGTAILWCYRRHHLAETAVWVIAILCVMVALTWYRLYAEVEPFWVEVGLVNEILPLSRNPMLAGSG